MVRQAGGHVKYTGSELASTLHTNSTGLYQPRPTFTLVLKAFKRLNVLDSTNDSRDNTTNGVTLAASRRALGLVSLASGSARSSPGLFNWLIRLRRRTGIDEDVIQISYSYSQIKGALVGLGLAVALQYLWFKSDNVGKNWL